MEMKSIIIYIYSDICECNDTHAKNFSVKDFTYKYIFQTNRSFHYFRAMMASHYVIFEFMTIALFVDFNIPSRIFIIQPIDFDEKYKLTIEWLLQKNFQF